MALSSQRGELALTLSFIALVVTLFGMSVGSFSVRQAQLQSRTSSAEEIFTYKSTLEVRNEQGNVIPWEAGFTWDNGLEGTTEITRGDIKMPNKPEARLIYDATKPPGVPKPLQGKASTVTLKIPDRWEVVSSFCSDVFGDSCSFTVVSEDKKVRSNIRINNGMEIVYGIIVKPRSTQTPTPTQTPSPTAPVTPSPTTTPRPTVTVVLTPTPTTTPRPTVLPTSTPVPTVTPTPTSPITPPVTPTPTAPVTPTSTPAPTGIPTPQSCPVAIPGCTPQNIKVTSITSREVSLTWTLPNDCSGFNYLTDDVWIDVVHQGVKSSIVCATDSRGTSATCTLGSPVPPGRIINTESPEFKTITWDAMRSYRVDVFLHSAQGACVSSPAQTTFIFDDFGQQKSQLPKIQRNIMLVEYNIPLVTQGNQSIYDVFDLPGSARAKVRDIPEAIISNIGAYSGIDYRISQRVNVTNIAPLLQTKDTEGIERLWTQCYVNGKSDICEQMKDTYKFSYKELDKMFDICTKVNNNEIDEVWHINYPGLSVGEDDMFGPKPFNINGLTEVVKRCKRNVPTLSIDLGRTYELGIHSFLHRFESTISTVFKVPRDNSNGSDPYSKFIAYPIHIAGPGNYGSPKAQEPYGCGSVHVPLYAEKEYGYNSGREVLSYCETFDNYPAVNVGDVARVKPMDSEDFFQHYFMSHVPRNFGRDAEGRLNNWWEYIAYPEKVIQDSDSSSAYLSDVNADNEINALDVSLLVTALGLDVLPDDEHRYNDINHDGMVNTVDLIEVFENYGEVIQPKIITHESQK